LRQKSEDSKEVKKTFFSLTIHFKHSHHSDYK